MGLFDEMAGAIHDPNQEGSTNELSNILSSVKQLSDDSGLDLSKTEVAMSVVGGHLRSALQKKQLENGTDSVVGVVNQFAGTVSDSKAVESLFSHAQITDIAQKISEKTGLNTSQSESLLPTLVPVILKVLKTGAGTQNNNQISNRLLTIFLDVDGDGDVDFVDMIKISKNDIKNPFKKWLFNIGRKLMPIISRFSGR
ncbi:hypothetical protein [Okeania sp.]|uniref:hypothetical protein n=1 Tax=Okeania sp. TaxID=3100323 RepID=UPI002B4B81ED|nr:hypothetical protein [Okeania sp.]